MQGINAIENNGSGQHLHIFNLLKQLLNDARHTTIDF